MADKEILQYFRSKGLHPFQAKIALNFVKDEDKRYWEIVTPPGTGKTFLTAALIAHGLEEGAKKRILVLAPRMLLATWRSMLLSFGPPFTAPDFTLLLVDRKTYLELESSVQVDESPWPLSGVILMSIDLAKRDDMITNLSSVTWDLVVFDESQILIGKRKVLFDRLTKWGAIRRALLLTNIESQLPSDVITKVAIKYADIVDWNGQPLFPSFRREVTPARYLRTTEEQTFFKEMQSFAERLANEWPHGKWLQELLLRAVSSSIYAAEGMLRRLADSWKLTRNKIAHDLPIVDEDIEAVQLELSMVVDDPWVINELSTGLTIPPQQFLGLYNRLESLLRQVEEIETDSKLDALISYVQERFEFDEKLYLCIWSSFASTIQFISSGVRDLSIPVYSLTSAVEPVERMHNVEKFRRTGGVLLTTDAVSEGLDLRNVDECINYDLPSNPRMFEQRWSRFIRFGRKTAFKMIVLVDQSKALPWEEEKLKSLGNIYLLEAETLGRPHQQQFWIFQTNPKRFRIFDWWRVVGDEDIWGINQHVYEVRKGDLVAAWVARGDSKRDIRGIYAIAEVISDPEMMLEPKKAIPYWTSEEDRKKFSNQPRLVVRIRYIKTFDRHTSRPLVSISAIKRDPKLSQLGILRFAQATNFPVTLSQWQRMMELAAPKA